MKARIFAYFILFGTIGCSKIATKNSQIEIEADDVKYTDSVFKKKCEYRGEEKGPSFINPNDIVEWHREKAAELGANTMVSYGYKSDMPQFFTSYFYCASNISPFLGRPKTVWIGHNMNSNHIDYKDIRKKCDYEVHKATLDLSRPQNERSIFYGTSDNAFLSLSNTLNQMQAKHNDWAANMKRSVDLEQAKIDLTNECLAANGLNLEHSNKLSDTEAFDKFCKDVDNINDPCIIPVQ
jgi:hypothetical protein